jgi:hypothetical protein
MDNSHSIGYATDSRRLPALARVVMSSVVGPGALGGGGHQSDPPAQGERAVDHGLIHLATN